LLTQRRHGAVMIDRGFVEEFKGFMESFACHSHLLCVAQTGVVSTGDGSSTVKHSRVYQPMAWSQYLLEVSPSIARWSVGSRKNLMSASSRQPQVEVVF